MEMLQKAAGLDPGWGGMSQGGHWGGGGEADWKDTAQIKSTTHGNTGSTFPSQKSSVTVRVNLPPSPPYPQPKHSQRIHRETEKKQDVLFSSVPVSQQAPDFLACSQAPPHAPSPLLPPLPTQLTGPGCRPGTGFPPPYGILPATPGMFGNSPPGRPSRFGKESLLSVPLQGRGN